MIKLSNVNAMKKTFRLRGILNLAGIVVLSSMVTPMRAGAVQQLMDYFQPTPIIGTLSSTCWGAAQVGHRDQSNGLEDKTLARYVYWDGGILKSGSTYYMFAARWDQSLGHNGWMSGSKAVWATSSNLYGPYTDQGYCFTDNGSAGHNVNVIKLKSGDPCGYVYGMTLSGAVAGSGRAYGANSLSGPWTYIGNFTLDMNGYSGTFIVHDNFRTFLGPDNKYHCLCDRIGIADNFMGPYKCQQPNGFCYCVSGSPTTNMEDPFQFYSGGKYHVLMNCWSAATAYSYTSTDGINFTMDQGFAYQPSANCVRYTDGTVNHWCLLERPSAYIENGHVVAFTFAGINVQKANDLANDQNGSKVIVVRFDGASFDSGVAPGTVHTVEKPQDVVVNNSILIPSLGAFKVDNTQGVDRVQFTNLLGKKVLEIPVGSGKAIGRCTLPYGLYLMNFYGKERIGSRSYKVLVR